MKETTKIKWKRYALYILIAEAVGGLSGFLTRDAMKLYGEQVIQPPLSPPGWLFPVVWSILYALMGIGAARISLSFPSRERTQALGIYWVQLGVNFLWSIVFFNLQWFVFSFFWLLLLWVLILWIPGDRSSCRESADSLSALGDLCGLLKFGGLDPEPVKSSFRKNSPSHQARTEHLRRQAVREKE